MTIGRADKRNKPLIPVAGSGRSLVWRSLAEPIWASGHDAAQTGRTHERTRPPIVLCQTALNPRGRPHMVLDAFLASRSSCERGAGLDRFRGDHCARDGAPTPISKLVCEPEL